MLVESIANSHKSGERITVLEIKVKEKEEKILDLDGGISFMRYLMQKKCPVLLEILKMQRLELLKLRISSVHSRRK